MATAKQQRPQAPRAGRRARRPPERGAARPRGPGRDRRPRLRQLPPAPRPGSTTCSPTSLDAGEDGYARLDLGAGERVNVEFVSANPTGPLHAGGGRWAAYGDSLCRILERCGHVVHREYYLNDRGVQMGLFGGVARRPQGRHRPARGRLRRGVHQRVGGGDARRRRPGRVGLRAGQAGARATSLGGDRRRVRHLVQRAEPGRVGAVEDTLRRPARRGAPPSTRTAPPGCAPPTSATTRTACW